VQRGHKLGAPAGSALWWTFVNARFAYGADTIEIIDSVPDDESHTARRLEEHISDLQYDDRVMRVPVTRHIVSTAAELTDVLSRLAGVTEANDLWPLIHIESHGSKEGLHLAKGDFLKWADIQPYFMRLNKATRNHFFVVMAACNGFHGIKAMIDVVDHAVSLRLLGGPAEETSSGSLEDAMKGFYSSLLRTGNLDAAADDARKSAPTFRIYSAEAAFMAGWKRAKEQFPTTAKGIQEKTEQIVTIMKKAGLALPERPHAKVKAAIREIDMNNPFQGYRKRFFMLDLFPEVEEEIASLDPDR
jgi:hypothetical protein